MAKSATAAAAVNEADKPGIKTTEFWGKSVVQILAMLDVIFDLGLGVTEEMVIPIVAAVEAAYTLGRSIVKAFTR